MKVTLDTNILISATFWNGDSARIIMLAEEKKYTIILSNSILTEYQEVLNSREILDKISNKNLTFNQTIEKIRQLAIIVEPKIFFDVVKDDPDDNMILECAVYGKSDYIITNDKHLLKLQEFQGIRIITPAEFFKIYLDT